MRYVAAMMVKSSKSSAAAAAAVAEAGSCRKARVFDRSIVAQLIDNR